MTTRRNFFGLAAGGGALVTALPLAQTAVAAAPAPLFDGVAAACRRLAAHGWRDLILKASKGAIDITGRGLKGALDKKLKADRTVVGFGDFGGQRGIEPGAPGSSLLYHAFASPSVTAESLTAYPTPAEIEAVENYVYGVKPPTLASLQARAGEDTLAVVVFAVEYRPARDAVHGDVADLCFTRTGIARMGDLEPAYNARMRCFEPIDPERPFSFRTIPQRFAPYLAVRRKGDGAFGPQDALSNDNERQFWVPLHKLFSGAECLKGLDLGVELQAHYRNEKLRRFHRYMRNQGFYTEYSEDDLNQFPFVIDDAMIASLSRDPAFGSGIVTPRPALFVNRAKYKDKWLSFVVPGNWATTPGVIYFSSGQVLAGSDEIPRIPEPDSPVSQGTEPFPTPEADTPHDEPDDWSAYFADLAANTDRYAPEYISVRHRLMSDGTLQDLNLLPDMFDVIHKGGYRAQHFIDFSGGGWVQAKTTGLPDAFKIGVPASSLISPPDFFPYVSQRDLTNWWKTETPAAVRDALWAIPPYPLSQRRMAGDINLPLGFNINDDTNTAIVSHPRVGATVKPSGGQPLRRTSGFPDNSPGVFDPGWDASQGVFYAADGQMLQRYLQNHGLGTPFVEDVKLCAALGSYWPAIAPDSTRTWTPLKHAPGPEEPYPWPTIVPLTDAETGIEAGPGGRLMPWDGINGPVKVERGDKPYWRYRNIDRADYIAMPGTMTAALLSQIDLEETKARVMAMETVYWALGIHDPEFTAKFGRNDYRAAIEVLAAKSGWAVASFKAVASGDAGLAAAEQQAGGSLGGRAYSFRLYVPKAEIPDPHDQQFVLVDVDGEEVSAYAGGGKALIRRGDGAWTLDASMPKS